MSSSGPTTAERLASDWRMPEFFIVGHQKCGTSALWEMLRRHPDIYMPEVIFFVLVLRGIATNGLRPFCAIFLLVKKIHCGRPFRGTPPPPCPPMSAMTPTPPPSADVLYG